MQQWMQARRAGRPVTNSVAINDATAIKISAVFAAVRILSGLASTLPAHVYEAKGGVSHGWWALGGGYAASANWVGV